MPIINEIEGRQWCELHGFEYCGTHINSNYEYIMEYDDGEFNKVSQEEEEYYLRQQAIFNEVWVVVSEDGINSTMYRSKNSKNRYTFYLSEAQKCTKVEAQKIAAIMTQRSRTGRIWSAIRIK